MKNFAERLKAARLMNGFSMQELADRSNGEFSKQAVGRYEKDLMKPSSESLQSLCSALGLKADYFARTTSVSLGKPSYRKLQKLSVKKQEIIKQKTIDYLERYIEIEEILNVHGSLNNPIKNLEITDKKKIEEAAREVRDKWELGNDALLNITETIEENSIKVFELDIDKSFSGMSAETESKERVIVLNNNEEITVERKRFTALHELGHQLMSIDREAFSEKEEESFCHYFAGAMLMPEETMYRELGRKRSKISFKEMIILKEQYGISMAALLYRAKDLDIITSNFFKQQMIIFGKLGFRKAEPGTFCGQEVSKRFLQLLLRAVSEDVITTSKAASLFNVKTAEFRKEMNGFI